MTFLHPVTTIYRETRGGKASSISYNIYTTSIPGPIWVTMNFSCGTARVFEACT